MSVPVMIVSGYLVMAVIMALLWHRQRKRKNAGIVDVAWSLGVGALAVYFALGADGYGPRRYLIGLMAGIWSLRLAGYLWRRLTSDEMEDGRYRELRDKWGEKTDFYLFFFFQIQAFWSVLFALPMLIAAHNRTPGLGLTDALGVLVWVIAMVGEGIADNQLARFRRRPENRGEVCRYGLWRYSRHPNYFFEWIHWWAYVLIGMQAPWGWLTLTGPVLMFIFLHKITGIPPTERHALASRGEAYREYQRTTSAFFPRKPKERKHRHAA
jgi:steroid 5-alpha reductase family enzyme